MKCLYCKQEWPEDRFPKRSALCYSCKARKSTLLRAVKSRNQIAIWHEVSHDPFLMTCMLDTFTSDPSNFCIAKFLLLYLELHPEKRRYYSHAIELIAGMSEMSRSGGSSSASCSGTSSSGGAASCSGTSSSGGAPPPPPPQELPAMESEGDEGSSSQQDDEGSSSEQEELMHFSIQGTVARRVLRKLH